MSDILSFDEFSAIRNRDRALKATKNVVGENISKAKPISSVAKASVTKVKIEAERGTKISPATELKSPVKVGILTSIGDFMELHETQFFCIFLIILDSYLAFLVSIMIPMSFEVNDDRAKHILDAVIPLIKSFTSFTQIYFMLELILIFLSFGLGVFGHLGYTIDFIVLAAQFYFDLVINTRESRVLNIFRLWRIYRLLTSLVNVEKDSHEVTKELLEEAESTCQKLEMDKANMEDDLKREKDARISVEEMLQDYKEEVDTLNEALKIAARDIAEVAETEDDFFNSDDDADEDVGSQITKDSKISKTSSGTTFLVHADGTFEQR